MAEAGIDGDEWTAIVAKCMAGQAAEFACTQAQQCYGAIGFTCEHEFHRHLRRMYVARPDVRRLAHARARDRHRLQETGIVPRIGNALTVRMDLAFPPEAEAFRAEVRAFLAEHLPP